MNIGLVMSALTLHSFFLFWCATVHSGLLISDEISLLPHPICRLTVFLHCSVCLTNFTAQCCVLQSFLWSRYCHRQRSLLPCAPYVRAGVATGQEGRSKQLIHRF